MPFVNRQPAQPWPDFVCLSRFSVRLVPESPDGNKMDVGRITCDLRVNVLAAFALLFAIGSDALAGGGRGSFIPPVDKERTALLPYAGQGYA